MAALSRYAWPLLSLIFGLAFGFLMQSQPSGGATLKKLAPASLRRAESHGPSEPLPGSVESKADGGLAWPPAVRRQMADPNYLEHSPTIWLPDEFLDHLRWRPGSFGANFKLSPEAKGILNLDDTEAARVEEAIDRFIADIREIERRYAQTLEKTETTVLVRVPAGLTANGPQQELKAELLPIMGPVGFSTFYAQITSNLRNISPVISGKQFDIRSTLLAEDKMETRIDQQGGGWSTLNVFPATYAHLLPPLIGTGDERRWQ